MSGDSPWQLEDFLLRFDSWVSDEAPTDDLRLHVLDWVFTRTSDPFSGARRVPDFADYWQAVLPHSEHFDDALERCAVVCLFWIDVRRRAVRCDRIASLTLPIE